LVNKVRNRREEKSYNKDSYLKEWIKKKAFLLLRWTLIRIKSIVEIFKELKKTGIKK